MPLPESSAKHAKAPEVSLHGNDHHVAERRSLRDYYIIVRERLWIALPVALLVSLSFGYYKSQETPMYSATATMLFERPERVVVSEQVVDTAVRSDIDLNNYLKTLDSGKLRAMVAQSLTPEEIKILQRPYLKELAPGANPPPVVMFKVAPPRLFVPRTTSSSLPKPGPEPFSSIARTEVPFKITLLLVKIPGLFPGEMMPLAAILPTTPEPARVAPGSTSRIGLCG